MAKRAGPFLGACCPLHLYPILSPVSRRPFPSHSSFQELPRCAYFLFLPLLYVFFFLFIHRFPSVHTPFARPVLCNASLLGNRRAGSVHRLPHLSPFRFLAMRARGRAVRRPAQIDPSVAFSGSCQRRRCRNLKRSERKDVRHSVRECKGS